MITLQWKAYSEIWDRKVSFNSSKWFWYSRQRIASSCGNHHYKGMWLNFLNKCIAIEALIRPLFFIVAILTETHTRDYLKIEALPFRVSSWKNKKSFCFSYPPLHYMPQITLFEWPSFTLINESLLAEIGIMPIYPELCWGWELERVYEN